MTALQTANQTAAASHPPSPAAIFETLSRHQHSMALKGAIELDIFTHIGAGASSPKEIAARCDASERGVRILCDFLTIMGMLRKSDQQYALVPDSAFFLDKASPAYLGGVAQFMVSDAMLARFRDIATLVRQGGAPREIETFDRETSKWVDFARFMTPMVILAAKATAAIVTEPHHSQQVLDIAAGSGSFGISIAQLNPYAEITALDRQNVLDVACENAVRNGVGDRFRTLPGSAFEVPLGTGYDLVLMPNFLHHFDPPTNVALLKKVRAALNPGGRIATVEFVPNDDRVTPPTPAAFSLTMLANAPSGDAYTFRELDGMLREGGFGESRRHTLLPTPLTLLVTGI